VSIADEAFGVLYFAENRFEEHVGLSEELDALARVRGEIDLFVDDRDLVLNRFNARKHRPRVAPLQDGRARVNQVFSARVSGIWPTTAFAGQRYFISDIHETSAGRRR
jgi:hypothetical protein